MPYSDVLPAIVFPAVRGVDADIKRALENQPGLTNSVKKCYEWWSDGNYPPRCRNARPEGDRNHNWCYRCPAGYMIMNIHEKDLETPTGRPLGVTGW